MEGIDSSGSMTCVEWRLAIDFSDDSDDWFDSFNSTGWFDSEDLLVSLSLSYWDGSSFVSSLFVARPEDVSLGRMALKQKHS
jgi:hypothetical protein